MLLDKYQSSSKGEENNVSKESPLATLSKYLAFFLLLFFVLFLIFLKAAVFIVPHVSLEKEAVFFGDISRYLNKGEVNLQKTEYIQEIVSSLDLENKNRFPYKAKVVCSPEENAFALPGGSILITSSLLKKMSSENELAFVLAHEMAHIKNRDVLRKIITQTPFILAGLFLSDYLDVDSINQIIRLKYDKDVELLADANALKMLNEKYGHVGGAYSFFQKLDEEDTYFLTWVSTHPSTKARMENIKKITEKSGFLEKEVKEIREFPQSHDCQ